MNSTTFLKPTLTFPHHSPEISTCKTMRDLNQIHANLIKTGLIADPLVASQLLKFSALSAPSQRDIHYAYKVFDQMPQPNCFSWNTIIRASVEVGDNGYSLQALNMFCVMLESEFVGPNKFTFPSVLKACANVGFVEVGKQVHGMIQKYGIERDEFVLSNLVRMYVVCGGMGDAFVLFNGNVCSSDCKKMNSGNVVLWNVMIDGYVKAGNFSVALDMFNEMPERSVVSWNSMISGFAQNGFYKEAVEMFREMQMGGVSPNYVTLVSVLPAVSRLGALELGKWIHIYALRNEIEIDEVLGSALIDMYSSCGSIVEALQIFKSLQHKNVITWNAMINGFASHGRARDAIDYFWRMEQVGIAASDVTYINVLTACSHAGLVAEGRAGLLEEAEQLILEMPCTADDVILKALLGACKIHGNIELGKRVANHLMEMSPYDSGSYVAMSNMYASLGNWEEVADVRLRMKELDVRKDPGCSWIELDGLVHEFLVEDDTHPRTKEIKFMLEEMSEQLSLTGYRSDTKQVFLNIDDNEKASALHYHSEKIALAFGLISTSPGTPLRIVKNLRICHDCHSTMKLISRLYKRKIVIRDRKRFHHIENGLCSCMDYW
ncbi:pentatricopeptide repeat-containing protein [Heracleum sosnowskyi]|uniref:Pentatricopeptide repeat-containing protein n=1 Tax=Heracleum sosnowskyi TaxID=360622 RepID=A0AAD8H442_9APIA|nr:pentatricopeptide repeat-containing protein [Heracleum sosnowskyi]